jgi:hypothetical protein
VKTSAAQAFPAILTYADVGRCCTFASLSEAADVSPGAALRARSHHRVNTSLSGTLFF